MKAWFTRIWMLLEALAVTLVIVGVLLGRDTTAAWLVAIFAALKVLTNKVEEEAP